MPHLLLEVTTTNKQSGGQRLPACPAARGRERCVYLQLILATCKRVNVLRRACIGFQANYTLPAKNFALFFKYYDEYSAKARVEGRTIVFGGSWTLKEEFRWCPAFAGAARSAS